MQSPTISVLMPVCNCEKYLKESIESVLNQTYEDFEFIIIDDGSTDKTLCISNEYANRDKRIKVINQSNSGIVVALNRCLREAKGQWIFRMDGDDIALPQRFSLQVKKIKEDSTLVLLGGWCQQINSKGKPLKVNKYPVKHMKLLRYLETEKPFFPHPTACFRRDIAIRLGGYRERFRHAEDLDLWLRLSRNGRIGCCGKVVLQLRKHNENISSFSAGRPQQIISVAARVCDMRDRRGLSDPSQMEESQWQAFLKWLEQSLEDKGYFQSRQAWQKLWSIWYSVQENRTKKLILLLEEILRDPFSMSYIKWKMEGTNFILKLAEESRYMEN
jgi:glycosyltransferase involved in cell wall biosynthesis